MIDVYCTKDGMRQTLILHIALNINAHRFHISGVLVGLLIADTHQGHHMVFPEGENILNIKGLT